jgi:hypothetical protein
MADETELNNSLEGGENTEDDFEIELEIAATEFLAKNTSGAKDAFRERTSYKKDAYPISAQSPAPIDVWYDKGLYGKVTPDYNAVVTADNWEIGNIVVPVLKKLPGDGEQIFAMNFVADAFIELQEHMYNAANRGQLSAKDSVLLPFTAKRGWTSFENRYRRYFENLYTGFASTYLNQDQKYEKVRDINGFMSAFSGFLEQTLPDFPISSTGYVLSGRYPLVATGLVIEISDSDHGDDQEKYEEYISDKNFLFYIGAARKFGFTVDKNAPWRLIADIKSKNMQSYMSKYPERPLDPGEPGPAPQLLCDLSKELFDKYYGQKIEFVSTEMINSSMSISGRIKECVCNPKDPEGTYFKVSTYCPGSDEDLYNTSPQNIPVFNARWAPRGIGSNTLLGPAPVFTPETNDVADLTLIGVGDIPVVTWLNTTLANDPSDGIPVRIFGSSDVDEYRWRIVDKPEGAVVRFLDYEDPLIIKGLGPNYEEAYTSGNNPNIRFKIYETSELTSDVAPSTEIEGDYLISVEGINLSNSLNPTITAPIFLTLRVGLNEDSRQLDTSLPGDPILGLPPGFSWLQALLDGAATPGGWSNPNAAEDSYPALAPRSREIRSGLKRRWDLILGIANSTPVDVTYPDPSDNNYTMRDGKVCNVSTIDDYEIPVIPSAEPPELQFILMQSDNVEFLNNRKKFELESKQYDTKLLAYNQRVDAKNLYDLQVEDYERIHSPSELKYGGPLLFDNVFSRQFNETLTLDLELIKGYILDFYNSYVMDQPSFSITEINPTAIGTNQCRLERKLITRAAMDSLYPDYFWLQFYFNLRIKESGIIVPKEKINNFQIRFQAEAASLLSSPTKTSGMKDMIERFLKIIREDTKGVIQEKIS